MIDALAKLLGIRADQTEDALKSERAARATLDRRGLLIAGATAAAALATGALWSPPPVQRIPSIKLARFDELLKKICSQTLRAPSHVFMHPDSYRALRKELTGEALDMPIVTHPHCPSDSIYVLPDPPPTFLEMGLEVGS